MRIALSIRFVLVVTLMVMMPSIASAHEGWGVVVDARGRVYVTDIPANTIWRISTDGRRDAVGRDIHSHALALGTDGAVYGSHASLIAPVVAVWRLDSSGRFTDVIPPTRNFPLGMQSFIRLPDSSVYSSNVYQHPEPPGGRSVYLLRWRPGGVIDTVAGGKAGHADGNGTAAQFESIDGMALLQDGSLVVADGGWLRRVSTSGQVTSVGAQLTQKRWDQDLLGVALGSDGLIYAADFAGRVVQRSNGARTDTLYQPGIFWAPTGITGTADGVVVLEHPRAPLGILGDIGIGPYLRVRRFGTSGNAVTLTTIWGRNTQKLAAVIAVIAGLIVLSVVLRRSRRTQRG